MPRRRSRARLTPTEAKEEFVRRAEELWDDFNTWYSTNPEATFDEIEAELGRRRREVVGEFVELSLRQGDLGAEPEAPICKKCRKPMAFQGYLRKTIHGLEIDAKIPRAYYYCSNCKEGFFPPGPTSSAEEG
ncbi:MAG TPA: hypothetical protein ENO24_04025 [Chloroflexi bacterium]|jgi:hypothetical protein|nr:hypothetical protein [Chloroflexota bacterium]